MQFVGHSRCDIGKCGDLYASVTQFLQYRYGFGICVCLKRKSLEKAISDFLRRNIHTPFSDYLAEYPFVRIISLTEFYRWIVAAQYFHPVRYILFGKLRQQLFTNVQKTVDRKSVV